MKREILAASLVAASLVATARATAADQLDDPKPDRVVTQQAAGHTFKVEIAGKDVRVTDQALVKRQTLAERDAMREAVKSASGCRLTDEIWPMDGRLRGRLDCAR